MGKARANPARSMWRRGPARFLSRAKPQKSHAALHTLVTDTSQIAGSTFCAARGATDRREDSTKRPFPGASATGALEYQLGQKLRDRVKQLPHHALPTFGGSSSLGRRMRNAT